MQAHRVEASLSILSGRARVTVDGNEVASLSGWRVGIGGRHIEFAVGERRCTLVVRPKPADPEGPDLDLHVDGWSVDTGARIEQRMAQESSEAPPLMRMVLIFLPAIGIPNLLSGARRTGDLSVVVGGGVVVAGALLAAAGFFAVGRWYAVRPPGAARTIVAWGMVLGCYALLFAAYAVLLAYAE